MKRHLHLKAFDWHGSSGMDPYIDQDRTELFEQQGNVLDVFEMSRDRHTVHSTGTILNNGMRLSLTTRDSTTSV